MVPLQITLAERIVLAAESEILSHILNQVAPLACCPFTQADVHVLVVHLPDSRVQLRNWFDSTAPSPDSARSGPSAAMIRAVSFSGSAENGETGSDPIGMMAGSGTGVPAATAAS